MATEDTEGHKTETVTMPATIPAPVAANLETVHPRLAVAVDAWWSGNMVSGEDWKQRQSYSQRDDLKDLITRILGEA